MVVFLNGRFVDVRTAKVSVFDHGFLYADGVYETLRTYGGFVWQPGEHLGRMRRSAKMIGLDVPWTLEQMERWILEAVKRNGFRESRIRVTVTRGENGFDFGKAMKPTICIQVQKLVPQPGSVYQKGVDAVVFRGKRILPEAKTLNLLPMVMAQRFMKEHNAYEAFFVDGKGNVKEGTVTNIFMVRKGVLVTPGKGILAGTTRDVLLKVARRLRLKVRVRDIKLREMYHAEELFITNAPRGIVPVRRVKGYAIGSEKWKAVKCPGPVTKMLMKAFQAKIEEFIAGQS